MAEIDYGYDTPDEPVESSDMVEETIDERVEEAVDSPEVADTPDEPTDETPTDNDWVYPDFVPDELVAPESFKSPEDELKWYRENYTKAIDVYKQEDFKKALGDNYVDYLLSQEKEVDKLKSLKEAFDGNPTAMIKAYFGKELKEAGIKVEFNKEERDYYVIDSLKNEYGEDYAKHYDPEDANKAGTLSYKMVQYQNKVLKDFENKAQEGDKVTEESRKALIEKAYDEDFADFMPKKEYDEFIQKLGEYQYGVVDLYNMMNHDQLVEASYQRGLSDAKQKPVITPTKRRVHRVPDYNKKELEETKNHDLEGYDYLKFTT